MWKTWSGKNHCAPYCNDSKYVLTKARNGNKEGYPILYSIIMFILGLFSCTNVVYAFVVGTTPILMVHFISFIGLVFILFVQQGILKNVPMYFSKHFLFFIVITLVSIVQILLFNRDCVYQWVVGEILILLNLNYILLILELKQYYKWLINGIIVGIIINGLISIYAYVLYQSGTIFTLAKFFPAASVARIIIYNAFHARGVFREQGHLMRFMLLYFFPIVAYLKQNHKVLSLVIGAIMVAIMASTASATLGIFAIGIFLYGLCINRGKEYKFILAFVGIGIAIGVVFYFSDYNQVLSNLVNSFTEGLFDFNASEDGSNSGRFAAMKTGLQVIREYPIIGSGWNTYTRMFNKLGLATEHTYGSYSAAITMAGDIGVGLFVYVLFFMYKGTSLALDRTNEFSMAIGISCILYICVFCLTDYAFACDNASLIALTMIIYRDKQIVNEVSKPNKSKYIRGT